MDVLKISLGASMRGRQPWIMTVNGRLLAQEIHYWIGRKPIQVFAAGAEKEFIVETLYEAEPRNG